MKKNKSTITILAVMVLITAVAAIWHLSTRSTTAEGTLRIEAGALVTELPLDQLELTKVQGIVVNGKGEEKTIDAQGTLLSAVLFKTGITKYTQVSVIADDEYSTTVEADEIAEADRVYLLITEDRRPQLMVFGDKNSKRNVSNVIRLVVS